MKLTRRFKHADSSQYPCACLLDKEGELSWIATVGKTWDEAEAEAIARAKAQLDAGPPPAQKEIEI